MHSVLFTTDTLSLDFVQILLLYSTNYHHWTICVVILRGVSQHFPGFPLILTVINIFLPFQTSSPIYWLGVLFCKSETKFQFSEGDYLKYVAVLTQEPLYLISMLYSAWLPACWAALSEVARLLCTMSDWLKTVLHFGKEGLLTQMHPYGNETI